MEIKYLTSPQGYIEYLENFSQVTKIGRNNRKRFYIGFTFIYLIVCIAMFVFVIFKNQSPIPYLIMFMIIYLVINIYMRYIDIVTIGARRKANKDIKNNLIQFDQLITIAMKDDHVVIQVKKREHKFFYNRIVGYSETANFVILYVTEIEAYVIPKKKCSEDFMLYIQTKITKIGV